MTTRALIVVRLSRVTDATTSPERQLQICQERCRERGYEVVGVAEDLDVSGSTDPFDRVSRPKLARWLAGERDPFDVIMTYRVDRLTRSIRHLQRLVAWAEDHDKLVISATETHFDMTSPWAAVLIAMLGTVAQMELEAISERNTSAAQYNLRAGKYTGGPTPWGYAPEKDEFDDWRLVQDPDQVAVINEVVRRVLDGEPLRSVAADLTARQVLTPRDLQALRQGREVSNFAWHSTGLKRALTSPTLLGYVVGRQPVLDAQGRPQRDSRGRKQYGPEAILRAEDGSPIVRAEPVLSRELFDRVGAELSARENRKEPTKRSTSLLLRIVFCGVCGRPCYKLKGGKGRAPRYRCASAQYKENCGNNSVPMEDADEVVTDSVMHLVGDSERRERVWDSGSDHSTELNLINETLADLAGVIGSGSYRPGTPQRAALNDRIAGLAARQAELSAEAVRPAGWTWRGTGELVRDWWNRQDTETRNIWMRENDVRLTIGGEYPYLVEPGDLAKYEQQLELGPTARAAVRHLIRE